MLRQDEIWIIIKYFLLFSSLPFLEKDDPMKLQEQILAGQLRLNKEGIDLTARDFLNQIF